MRTATHITLPIITEVTNWTINDINDCASNLYIKNNQSAAIIGTITIPIEFISGYDLYLLHNKREEDIIDEEPPKAAGRAALPSQSSRGNAILRNHPQQYGNTTSPQHRDHTDNANPCSTP